MHVLPLTAGAVSALITVYVARRLPLAREQTFYCALLVVIAAIYPLAGLLQQLDPTVVLWETVAAAAFAAVAWVAWRRQPALVVLGLLAHALWDVAHGPQAAQAMPIWYAPLCLAYDLVVTVYAASRLGDWGVLEHA